MSRGIRDNRPAQRHAKPYKQQAVSPGKGRSKKEVAAIIVIAALAAIPFTLGRYFELNYPDPFDSGANVYSAKHILDGARIGVEERARS
jgi:hypothetical protein